MTINDILVSVTAMITALGGFEALKFVITNIQGKKKRNLSDESETVNFYKKEFNDLRDDYRRLSDELSRVREQVLEQGKTISSQGQLIAELTSELNTYRCTTKNCPYRNRGDYGTVVNTIKAEN